MKPSSGNNNNPHYSLARLDESVKIAMEIIYNFCILAYRLMTGYTIQISGHAIFSYTNHDFYFLFLLLWNPKCKKIIWSVHVPRYNLNKPIKWYRFSGTMPYMQQTRKYKKQHCQDKTNQLIYNMQNTESKLWNMQKHSQLSIASQSASNNWIQV